MVQYKTGTECIDWLQLIRLYGEVGLVSGYGQKKDGQRIRQPFGGYGLGWRDYCRGWANDL